MKKTPALAEPERSRAAHMQRPLVKRALGVALLLLALPVAALPLTGCQERKASPGDGAASTEAAQGLPFTVDSQVLYTWVKDDGSFQLSEKLEEIPAPARQAVRVVVDGQPPGTPTHVFVADLTSAKAGDARSATALERTAWEARGLNFRKTKVEPLEQQAKAEQAAQAPVMADGKAAIVYGADWCGPCHQAEDYLKKRGMAVTKKNIEEDQSAVGEMRAKLKAAGLGISSSIPILDVAGTMLIGFSPRAIDAAIRNAK